MQRHLRHVGLDLGDLDAVVGVNRPLPDARHVVPQCRHCAASTSRLRVGFGCNGRCAPGCALLLGRGGASSLLFCPRAGGVLELSGVFGGSFSFARSSAFSFSSASSRLLNSSIRASNVAISASFSALDNEEESNGKVIHRLTHIPSLAARGFPASPIPPSTPDPPSKPGVSNYAASARTVAICLGIVFLVGDRSARPDVGSDIEENLEIATITGFAAGASVNCLSFLSFIASPSRYFREETKHDTGETRPCEPSSDEAGHRHLIPAGAHLRQRLNALDLK